MQLQIYIIFEKLWHKMSFKQRLKSSYTMTRFEFSWKMIPESRSRDRKRPITPGPFWSWFLWEWHVAGAQIAWRSIDLKQLLHTLAQVSKGCTGSLWDLAHPFVEFYVLNGPKSWSTMSWVGYKYTNGTLYVGNSNKYDCLTSSRRELYFIRSPDTGLFSVKIQTKFLTINNCCCQWKEVRTTK